MPADKKNPLSDPGPSKNQINNLFTEQPTQRDEQIQNLQESLTEERDARKEERFIFIVLLTLLLDIVFFSVMPTFGGPIALLVLELLVLIPLAKRMGMEEVAAILSRALDRIAGKSNGGD